MPPKPPPGDAAATERIITHMNRDHADSLTRYLEAHAGLSSISTRNARLTSLTTSSMTIASSGLFGTITTTIPLSPPMGSLSEARERLVAMDKAAAKKLGKSPFTVKKYKGSEGLVNLWVLFVAGAWLLNARSEHGRLVGEWVGDQRVGDFLQQAQPVVLAVMLSLHIAEAFLQSYRCVKHSIPLGSALWCKWVGAVAVEGFTALGRFQGVVGEEKKRLESAKH